MLRRMGIFLLLFLLLPLLSVDVEAAKTVIIEIDYNGEWQGDISGGSSRSVNGNGSRTYTISGDIIVVIIQKQDDSTNRLRVKMKYNSDVIESESTTTPYGIVTISHSFLDEEVEEIESGMNTACNVVSFFLGGFIASGILISIYLLRRKKPKPTSILAEY